MRIKEISEGGMFMYKSLADAGPEYAPGNGAQVWYWKDQYARDMMMGLEFAIKKQVFDPNDITKTHDLLGTLKESDPEKIWMMMQGEAWSPEGQGRWLIDNGDFGHTSMSVGDILVIGKRIIMVDSMGFVDVATGAKV